MAIPWWTRVKRFGIPGFDESRYAKNGNLYTLKRADPNLDRWVVASDIKSAKKFDPEDKVYISGCMNENIIDRAKERVNPHGMDAESFLKNPVLLAHHSYYAPIGQVESLEAKDTGVDYEGWVGNPTAVGGASNLTVMQREIRSLVVQKILRTSSIGFIPHKFRMPLYNDEGVMEEPLVIENWELLENSLVAVPCNQGALFETLDAQAPGASKRFYALGGLALNANEKALLPKASEDSTKGQDPTPSGERAMAVVQTVAGKEKKGSAAKTPPAANEEVKSDDEYKKESLTLLRAIGDGLKSSIEMQGEMMKLLVKKPSEEEDTEEEEEEEEEEEDEDKKAADAALLARLDSIEKTQTSIVEALTKITTKVFG